MKRLIKLSFVLLAMLGVLFTSCKKEYENPPIDPLPVGEVITIGDILSMSPKTSFDGASVCGIVTADEQSGNLYKQIFIQDAATGKAIELMLNTSSAARIGDMVRVYLDSTIMFDMYHNLPQLVNSRDGKGFNPDKHLYIYPHNDTIVPIEPQTVTIADIKTGNYTAALVRLENVEFADQNTTFCDMGSTTNRTLKDATGEIIVRTSNYANFAYDMLPVGQGSLVAIASVYNSDWQLILRSTRTKEDFDFVGGTPNPPAPAGEVQSMPYSQSFATEFGTYMTYSVLDDNHVWIIDYSSAVMTGHEKVGDQHFYYENEDWLISSPVEITSGIDHAKMVMNYAAKFGAPADNDVTLQVSKDYIFGTDPRTATWEDQQVTYPNTSSNNEWVFLDKDASLDGFIGETVTVAIKFTSSTSASRTFEVKSITIQEGEAGGGVTPPPGPGTIEGDGSRENPYTANDIILLGIETSDGNKYWVKDYIVGVINSNYEYVFTSSTDVITNLTMSSNVNASNESECIPVQLPPGVIRNALNLSDNPGNYQQEVLLYGTLEAYFRKAGVKNVTYAEINGNSIGSDPGGGGGGEATEYFNETLTTQASFNTFSAYSVTGDQEWYQNNSHLDYGAVMSGFANNTSYANEDWFISPVIDLSASTNPILTFDHARGPQDSMNVGVEEGYYTVWVTNDYPDGADPSQERWVELPILNQPTVKWQFVSAGNLVIPAEFKTATCRIAFRYLSVDGASATWEIKNVVVKEQ